MIFQKSACIETLYTELPFLERFRAAKADGFDFVEFWSWTDKDLAAVKVPTVILHGAKDVVVSSDLARLQHEGIADSRLITLPNSGHGIMYDELERFNRVFFASLPGWDE